MRRLTRTLSLALTVLALTGGVRAQPSDTTLAARLDDAVQRYVDLGRFAGTVLVARGEEVVLARGYGEASVEHHVPNTLRTRFDIGSLAKQFVAAAVLTLASEGRVDLHAPIRRYLPDYAEGERVTLHHLLTHTAGVPSLGRRDGITDVEESADPIARDDLLAIVTERPLQFEPGAEFRYSNSGYAVAAAVVEAVSGLPLVDYLERNLWVPSGMTATGSLDTEAVIPDLAGGYVGFPPRLERAQGIHPSWHFGAGGLYSTAEDLFRWNRALTTHAVLTPAASAAFVAPHVERGQRPAYGYGWFRYRLHGRPIINHGGTTEGFVCEFYRFPDDDLFVVVLANLQPEVGVNIPAALGEALSGIVFGAEVTLPPRLAARAPETASVVGTYAFAPDASVEVYERDGALRLRTLGPTPWSLDVLERRLALDRSDPRVIGGTRTLEALVTGRGAAFRNALVPERQEDIEETYASEFAARYRERYGAVEAVVPYALDANEREAILQTRVQFERGELYLHLEMTPEGEAFGWYIDDILPRDTPLYPNAAGGFFVDVFPRSSPGTPDALFLTFPDPNTLRLTTEATLDARRTREQTSSAQ